MHMHQKKQPNNTTATMQTIPMQKLEKMHEKNKQPNKQRTKKTTQKGGEIKKNDTRRTHTSNNTTNKRIRS